MSEAAVAGSVQEIMHRDKMHVPYLWTSLSTQLASCLAYITARRARLATLGMFPTLVTYSRPDGE
jgi:hypothetical protein